MATLTITDKLLLATTANLGVMGYGGILILLLIDLISKLGLKSPGASLWPWDTNSLKFSITLI